MKLNLGCGDHKIEGYVNVDKHGSPDLKHDLEQFPWPWPDSSVDEMLFHHSLEHMGFHPDTFIGIMKEIYRVCSPDAVIKVIVPHPRHHNFLNDPTHVRPITPEVIALFSKKQCEMVRKIGAANSPLADYHDVDFEIADLKYAPDEYWSSLGDMTEESRRHAMLSYNGVVSEIHMELRVVK